MNRADVHRPNLFDPCRSEPTSGLVGIIVAISKPLREFDLGEIEPATYYVAD